MTSRQTIHVMAVGCGLSVANLYYSQPLLVDIARDFAVGDREMGLVTMLSQVGYAAGLFCFVPLGDLLERRGFILVMLAAATLALMAVAVSPSFAWLAVASLLLGASTIVPQLIIPFAAAIAEPGDRGKVVGTVMSGLLVGILSARTVSGVVGGWLGWRAMYAIAALLMVMLILAFRGLLPCTGASASGLTYSALLRSLLVLVREEPVLRHSALFGALTFAAFSVFWTTLAFHLSRPPFGYRSDAVGLFGLIGVGGALAAPLIGGFADRRSARWTIGIGLWLMLLSFGVFALLGRTLFGMVLGVVLLDLGVQCSHVSNQALIYGLRPEARNRLNTVYMVTFFCGGAIGSLAGSQAWGRWGWTAVCGAGAGFLALALCAFQATARKPGCQRAVIHDAHAP
jgi:predicted MFS family arabinose efflux permease